jgi:hypothetical protein
MEKIETQVLDSGNENCGYPGMIKGQVPGKRKNEICGKNKERRDDPGNGEIKINP